MPKTIVSNRNTILLSNFWQELFSLQGRTLKFSSAYHLQIDGQTEVTNKIPQTYLRCFISHQPSEWTNWLTPAEYWFNKPTKLTPYEVVYGKQPPSLLSYVPHTAKAEQVEQHLSSRDITLQS